MKHLYLIIIFLAWCVFYFGGWQYGSHASISQFQCLGYRAIVEPIRYAYEWKYHLFSNNNTLYSNKYNSYQSSVWLVSFLDSHSTECSYDETRLSILNLKVNSLVCLNPIPSQCIINDQSWNLNHLFVTLTDKQKLMLSVFQQSMLNLGIENVSISWILGNSHNINNDSNAATIIYLHGGSLTFGGSSHLGLACQLSNLTQTRILYVWFVYLLIFFECFFLPFLLRICVKKK